MNKAFRTLLLATVATAITCGAAFAKDKDKDDPVPAPIPTNQFAGNDCNNAGGGVSGGGFNGCTYTPTGGAPSPIIARFDVNDAGTGGSWTINSTAFPSVTGTEFSFSGLGETGTWTYTPNDAGDPVITAFVAKGGPFFRVFTDPDGVDGAVDTGNWETPVQEFLDKDGNIRFYGLSHLTFFDTRVPDDGGGGGGGNETPVPAPAALALFGLGLLGMGLARRRRRA
jgi:hypothetical protein